MGRRVEYIETVGGVTNTHHRFVYDGYVCIQRLNAAANNSIDLVFGWDPSEPVATRPLVLQKYGQYNLFYTHDGNKNVSELVFFQQANGIAAHYEYAPFGAVTATSRNTPVTAYDFREYNPFRFSSEYINDVLGLVYYNYRHYEQVMGRWLSKDPIGVVGGWNMYAYVANRPMSIADILGLSCCPGDKRIVAIIYEDASSISRGNPDFDNLRALLKDLKILNYIQLGTAGATGVIDGLIAGAGKGVSSVAVSGTDFIVGNQFSPDAGGAVSAIERMYDKLKSFYPKLRGRLYYQECEKLLFLWTHWVDKVVGPSEWIQVDINYIDQPNPIKTYGEAKEIISNELLSGFKELIGGGK